MYWTATRSHNCQRSSSVSKISPASFFSPPPSGNFLTLTSVFPFSIFQEKPSSLPFHHRHSSQSYPELSVSVLDGPVGASQLLRCRWTQGKRTKRAHATRQSSSKPFHTIPASCSVFGQGEAKSNTTFNISKEDLCRPKAAVNCVRTETSRVKCINKAPESFRRITNAETGGHSSSLHNMSHYSSDQRFVKLSVDWMLLQDVAKDQSSV